MSTRKILTIVTAALASLALLAAAPAAPTANTGVSFDVELTEDEEVGDFSGVEGASGDVTLRLNPGQQQICVDGTINGFKPVLAHIHEAPAGENGGVVVFLDSTIDDNTLDGCVGVERSLIRDIITDPSDYYVNVHLGNTPPTFFQGVRGQLGR